MPNADEEQARDFMKTTMDLVGRRRSTGKPSIAAKNAINNFCVSIAGNEPRCTSCHAGYGGGRQRTSTSQPAKH